MKQRFTLHGAFDDYSLPAPAFRDGKETWGVIVDEVGEDDIHGYDGLKEANALRFRKTKVVEFMMALDLDSGQASEGESSEDDPPKFGNGASADFAAINPDVDEAEFIGDQPAAAVNRDRLRWPHAALRLAKG